MTTKNEDKEYNEEYVTGGYGYVILDYSNDIAMKVIENTDIKIYGIKEDIIKEIGIYNLLNDIKICTPRKSTNLI